MAWPGGAVRRTAAAAGARGALLLVVAAVALGVGASAPRPGGCIRARAHQVAGGRGMGKKRRGGAGADDSMADTAGEGGAANPGVIGDELERVDVRLKVCP